MGLGEDAVELVESDGAGLVADRLDEGGDAEDAANHLLVIDQSTSSEVISAAMKTLTIECPDHLHDQLQQLVRDGWLSDPAEAVLEALRRYLDTHGPDLTEDQIRQDVQWGLLGDD
jgi:hypothetical protein